MTIRTILTFVSAVICSQSISQIIVLPSEYIITIPSKGIFNFEELSKVPMAAINRSDFELEDYYNEILQESMQNWFEDNYEDVSFYSLEDSLINYRAFQGGVKREQAIYEALKSKPLFGYSGYKPTPGLNLKHHTVKLQEEFNKEYIIYTNITSLLKASRRDRNDNPDYRGHLTGYCWIIDAKTGEILQEAMQKGPKKIKSRWSILDQKFSYTYVPRYKVVDEDYVLRFSKKLQKKLKRKLAKEGFR